MTDSTLVRLVARGLVPVVLAMSGGYLVVYLYRWEWNRALISGLFFLAAEVAYVGASLHREIRLLEVRTSALEDDARARLHARLGENDVRPARPFAWLRDDAAGRTGVFVPLLLGAGVLFTAVAFVVERVSGAVARGTVDRATARHLAGLEPLPHGLLAEPARPRSDGHRRRPRWIDVVSRLGAALVLVVAVGAAVEMLADATQSRPAPVLDGTSTVIELQVDQHRRRPALDAAEALVIACRGALAPGVEVTSVTPLGGDRVELVVEPALGEQRRRRLFGCLEDATLDLIQAHVVGWDDRPAAGS